MDREKVDDFGRKVAETVRSVVGAAENPARVALKP